MTEKTADVRSQELADIIHDWYGRSGSQIGQYRLSHLKTGKLIREIERLQETLACPRLTADAPTDQFAAVLSDHEKGQPVNGQDLINALMWRVRNQRKEIARLNEALRRKASDEAPSFSPNFDERNGIR